MLDRGAAACQVFVMMLKSLLCRLGLSLNLRLRRWCLRWKIMNRRPLEGILCFWLIRRIISYCWPFKLEHNLLSLRSYVFRLLWRWWWWLDHDYRGSLDLGRRNLLWRWGLRCLYHRLGRLLVLHYDSNLCLRLSLLRLSSMLLRF